MSSLSILRRETIPLKAIDDNYPKYIICKAKASWMTWMVSD
jgi:hypothetical protein